MSLSVVIIARDEQRHIAGAIESTYDLADQCLVLLDDRTTDSSALIAHSRGADVRIEPWRGFPAQRNRALDLCTSDWVLFLDADERITNELRIEIRQIVSDVGNTTAGYWIPRYNQFFHKIVRGGGWYPDYQLRLMRRQRARYDETRLVHELVQLDGSAEYLHGHLLHFNIERLDEFWSKQTSYAIQEAQTLFLAGRRTQWRNFIGAPLREFRRRYIQLRGYRDGFLGLFLCAALAYFEIVKFAHLKGLELSER
jgi:glycosyltransferase involved in cell wall biosynthesis